MAASLAGDGFKKRAWQVCPARELWHQLHLASTLGEPQELRQVWQVQDSFSGSFFGRDLGFGVWGLGFSGHSVRQYGRLEGALGTAWVGSYMRLVLGLCRVHQLAHCAVKASSLTTSIVHSAGQDAS